MNTKIQKFLSVLSVIMLFAAVTIEMTGCAGINATATNSTSSITVSSNEGAAKSNNDSSSDETDSQTTESSMFSASDETESTTAETEEAIAIGEGAVQFTFEVVDIDQNLTTYLVSTDEKTVGGALLNLNLLEGEMGDYGLYVKKVSGITADFDADGTYWAFYIDGEYASSGVDTTNITPGEIYSFRVEK